MVLLALSWSWGVHFRSSLEWSTPVSCWCYPNDGADHFQPKSRFNRNRLLWALFRWFMLILNPDYQLPLPDLSHTSDLPGLTLIRQCRCKMWTGGAFSGIVGQPKPVAGSFRCFILCPRTLCPPSTDHRYDFWGVRSALQSCYVYWVYCKSANSFPGPQQELCGGRKKTWINTSGILLEGRASHTPIGTLRTRWYLCCVLRLIFTSHTQGPVASPCWEAANFAKSPRHCAHQRKELRIQSSRCQVYHRASFHLLTEQHNSWWLVSDIFCCSTFPGLWSQLTSSCFGFLCVDIPSTFDDFQRMSIRR